MYKTNQEIEHILNVFLRDVQELYGNKLEKVLLYGSYARGEQRNGLDASDIDIMVLVDMNESELKQYEEKLIDSITDINLEYDVVLSPVIQPLQQYLKYRKESLFFENVDREGVLIGA